LTILPYQDTRRRARRQLDRPAILAAALALMDQVGLDGLTMRRLAEELEVTPGSLYRHVRDKDELLVLLADEISGQMPMVRQDVPWQAALTEMAVAVRRGLLAHRDAARLLASTPPAGPRRLRHIEAMLRVLLDAGFSDRDAAWAAYHFNNLVTEFVADEVRLASAAAAAGRSRSELLAEGRAQLRALPSDEFPSLVRLAEYVASDNAEAVFEFGLRLCLRGLEALGPDSEAAAGPMGYDTAPR
jgi:TetR/AcrR family transcriptional regulator, tetracycline repressor protein